jgi:hypothetical protein
MKATSQSRSVGLPVPGGHLRAHSDGEIALDLATPVKPAEAVWWVNCNVRKGGKRTSGCGAEIKLLAQAGRIWHA